MSKSQSKPIRRGRVPKTRRPPKPQPADIATNADYLTRREVAAIMRVDIQTVDYCIRHRGLPAHKFGHRVLIKRVDLEEFLQRNRVLSSVG